MKHYRLSSLLIGCILSSSVLPVYAVHLDIELKGDNERITTGFCLTEGVGCDLPGALSKLGLPPRTLPVDSVTGYKIFAADFADFPKPYDTANPGFNALTGSLLPNELLAYRALGNLQYWHPTEKRWMSADDDVQIRLFGGLSATQVITDPSQCGGFLICVPEGSGYEEGSTVFSAAGISSSASLLIDNANSEGAFHTHLDWFLEKSSGEKGGPQGAYLVQLQLESDKRTLPSQPLMIAFNSGLTDDGFAEAIAARITAAVPSPTPSPEPTPQPEPTIPQVPVPTPQPAPIATPATLADRTFSQFKYEENAQEKLIGCPKDCQEVTRGRVTVTAKVNFDNEITASKLVAAEKINFSLGTRQFIGRISDATHKKLNKAGASGGNIKIKVKNTHNQLAGTLVMKWTGKQLTLTYKLSNSVFADNFLSDPLTRPDLLESVSLRLEDITGELVLPVKATPEFVASNRKSKMIKRGGSTYELNSVYLKNRKQS